MATSRQVEVDGRELKLTNLDKVLYPEAGFTKGEVVDYYAKVAPAIVPHLTGRAVTLRRFPEGVDDLDAAFFEKRCPKHRPKWVKTTPVSASTGKIDFCVCDSLPTLIWMAQLAAIELHPSLSLSRAPKRPTVLAFDLDPGPPADVVDCCQVGLRLRDLFGHFDVRSFPKTSGSKGLQIYVPLNQKASYEQTKPFAKAIAQLLEKQTPDKVVSKMKRSNARARSSSTGPRTTSARRRSPSTRCAPANAQPPRPRSAGRRSRRCRQRRWILARLRSGRRPQADRAAR